MRHPFLAIKRLTLLLLLCWGIGIPGATGHPVVQSTLSYRRFTTQDGLPQMQTETVWQDSRGYVYIGTLSGFVRYDGRELTPFLKGRRMNIVDFQEVGGTVHAISFRQYWKVDTHRPQLSDMAFLAPGGSRLTDNFNSSDLPPGFLLTEDGEERNRQLCRVTANGLLPVMSSRLFDEMTPDRKLFMDSTGIYVPTPQGLYRLQPPAGMQGKEPSPATPDGGQEELLSPRPDIYSLCRHQGRLLAFAEDGIYSVESGEAVVTADGLATDYGLIVRATHDGLLVADAHSLYLFDGHSLLLIATGFNLIKDLFIDRWDRLWMATYQGVYCFFNRRFRNHLLTDANDIVRAMATLPDGQLVTGTLNGKLIIGDSIVSDQPDNFFVPSSATLDGKVYMACRGNMACISDSGWHWLNLPIGRYQFVAKAGERLILGTRQMILAYHPSTGAIDTLTTGIAHPWCAAEADDGRLWVGSTYGLFSLSRDGSLQQADYEKRHMVVTAMARYTPSSADGHGAVFFASFDSLYTISSGKVSAAPDSFNARLSGHEVRSIHVSPRGFLVVAVIDGFFVARIADGDIPGLTDICFFDHRNGFTMIEPQQALMAETPDGTVYMACLEGMTSFRPEELLADSHAVTTVTPPLEWWQRWWVMAIGAVVAMALIAGLVVLAERRRNRRRMRRLQREKKQKELQINAIRLKAIPHFHANVLAGIEYFLMNDSTAEATRYLKLYSDFTNQTLSDIDRPARTIAEEVAYTRLYLQLEQLRYGDRLNYSITVASDVNQQLPLPTMLLHTYCQNALKHGIGNRPEGGHIEVSISRSTNSATVVSVSDDGIGRAAAAHLNTNSTKQGLRILMEQIELYNQTNRRPIRQTVSDLYDAQGQPAGTCFQLTVPSDYHFDK